MDATAKAQAFFDAVFAESPAECARVAAFFRSPMAPGYEALKIRVNAPKTHHPSADSTTAYLLVHSQKAGGR